MTKWINNKGEVYNGKYIVAEGKKYLSPTQKTLARFGYQKVETPTPKGNEREQQIYALKAQLQESDYKAIKFAEGWISEDDYAPIKAERQALRDQINALENEE